VCQGRPAFNFPFHARYPPSPYPLVGGMAWSLRWVKGDGQDSRPHITRQEDRYLPARGGSRARQPDRWTWHY
jgi:hypothetical protein